MKLHSGGMQPANRRLINLSLVLSATLASAQANNDIASSPYAAIAKRNVFDLKEYVPPVVEAPRPVEPPANITLYGAKEHQGIRYAIVGVQQLPKPPQPASTKTYTIKEGDTMGPITVERITNIKTGEMEIVNNGTKQSLSFKSHAGKMTSVGTPGFPGVVAPGGVAGMPAPLPIYNSGVPQPVATPAARTFVATPGAMDSAGATPVVRPMRPTTSAQLGGLGVINSGAAVAQQPAGAAQNPEQLSRASQAILIEIERKRTQNAVDLGLMPPLPPTELNPNAAPHQQ